jgi:hypothetical protein
MKALRAVGGWLWPFGELVVYQPTGSAGSSSHARPRCVCEVLSSLLTREHGIGSSASNEEQMMIENK